MSMITDPAFEMVSGEVAAARDALVDAARADSERWWSAHELKIHARNGWSSGAMSLAMNDLVEDGTFELNDDLRVRLCK
jgi:3-oxoacyl-ACP reductase-like protein